MIEPLLTPRVGYVATKVTKEITGFLVTPTPSTERLHLYTQCARLPRRMLLRAGPFWSLVRWCVVRSVRRGP
jgi:hypothetical protein